MWSFSQNTLLYRFNVFSILTERLPLHYACNSCNLRWDSKTSTFSLFLLHSFSEDWFLTIDLSNFSIWFVVCFFFSSPVIKSETFTFPGFPCGSAAKESTCNGWDGWMASLTQWTWVWANSGRQWRTGKPGTLQSIGSQRVRHDWANKTRFQVSKRVW